MIAITRDSLPARWRWRLGEIEGCDYMILRKDGSVYDAYKDRVTAIRVFVDLVGRYGDGQFELAEVF